MFSTKEFLSRMVYEDNGWYVYSDPKKSYYEVFAPDVTCAYRIASVSKSFGLQRAIAEINKRKHDVHATVKLHQQEKDYVDIRKTRTIA